jgi:hypothetical protein
MDDQGQPFCWGIVHVLGLLCVCVALLLAGIVANVVLDPGVLHG